MRDRIGQIPVLIASLGPAQTKSISNRSFFSPRKQKRPTPWIVMEMQTFPSWEQWLMLPQVENSRPSAHCWELQGSAGSPYLLWSVTTRWPDPVRPWLPSSWTWVPWSGRISAGWVHHGPEGPPTLAGWPTGHMCYAEWVLLRAEQVGHPLSHASRAPRLGTHGPLASHSHMGGHRQSPDWAGQSLAGSRAQSWSESTTGPKPWLGHPPKFLTPSGTQSSYQLGRNPLPQAGCWAGQPWTCPVFHNPERHLSDCPSFTTTCSLDPSVNICLPNFTYLFIFER